MVAGILCLLFLEHSRLVWIKACTRICGDVIVGIGAFPRDYSVTPPRESSPPGDKYAEGGPVSFMRALENDTCQ